MQKSSIALVHSARGAARHASPPDRWTTKTVTITFVVVMVLLWIAVSALMIFETQLS
jgi:hypothetical protein